MLKEFLKEIGINLQLSLAGFVGGTVNALAVRKATLAEILGIVITGMAAANYLGEVAVKYTGAPELATGFIVGLSGMVICRGIISAAQAIKFGKGNGRESGPSG